MNGVLDLEAFRHERQNPTGTFVLAANLEIRRPIEHVFELVADPTRFPEFFPGILSVTPLAKSSGAPGSERYVERSRYPFWGEVENMIELVERRRNERAVFDALTAPVATRFHYRVQRLPGDGTRLDWDCRLKGRSPYLRLLYAPIMRRVMRPRTREAMANLKALLESSHEIPNSHETPKTGV